MTKEEHNKIEINKRFNIDASIFDLDWQLGYFTSNKVAGFHFTFKREGDFINFNFKDKVEKKRDTSKPNYTYYYSKK
jgi:hypothetical protein